MVRLALIVLVAAVVAAPLLGAAGLPIYAAFSWVCHQRPERSWQLAGYPLAVCVRCFGLYTGALAGAFLTRRFSRALLLVSVGLLAADWLAETAGWLGPCPAARYLAGFAAGFFLVPALRREHPLFSIRSKWMRKEAGV